MQARLYDLGARRRPPVTDVNMWRILRRLRACLDVAPFRLWLVGSRLEVGHDTSDIDLVLSPRADVVLDDSTIDTGLWRCREAGLNDCDPSCVFDPCFRLEGPSLHPVPLRRDAILRTIKLLSPRLVRLIQTGRITDYRRVGRYSVAFTRLAVETDYYAKLPRKAFDGDAKPYLRPAIEIVEAEGAADCL